MKTHSWNDFIDKTQGMDKRRKTQAIFNTEGGKCIRRGEEIQANWKNFLTKHRFTRQFSSL